MTSGQYRAIVARVALRRTDVADAAVPVLVVVPMHEARGPQAGLIEIVEALPAVGWAGRTSSRTAWSSDKTRKITYWASEDTPAPVAPILADEEPAIPSYLYNPFRRPALKA